MTVPHLNLSEFELSPPAQQTNTGSFKTIMLLRSSINEIEIAAPAKINWFLELLSRRADGFHELETVMSTVSIFDRMKFTRRTDSNFILSIRRLEHGSLPKEKDSIPCDQRNLIIRSLHLLRETAREQQNDDCCQEGITIELDKQIPSAAGLGGASSNAAAALIAGNQLWQLNWDREKLSQIAAQLGSDIPFFLHGGTAICRGRGEKIEPVQASCGIPVVIAKPDFGIPTASIFNRVTIPTHPINSNNFISSFQRIDQHTLGANMFNRLQEFAEPISPAITQTFLSLKKEFSRLNCLGHQMSGSGSSYFGVFSTARAARYATQYLAARFPDTRVFFTQTLTQIAS
ncbi:4-(cytidine 5'-diphospho)-2-C-methyl-D-erythritol kinase [Mariniblastus sp.]|nr:4-(cytidine 5'-diphospho)-2-C-methyl-D-erythritol kinase [bacterium]MDA7903747.1 4-(cytidine 5'-diphospho)-2-C-methyl-D-erythritol kinase [Mariniblastus sp.]MDA7910163.1 4-(cytidine 5'-diphospho)-2-C-methyl-D-erythritol kinase [bacterium]MDB4368930.1 4-(cytidine 5'-diphospho)-2-C-methyl-D-erythritol kinase [bacterium]MDB4379952.1 4-(cytidine 5'-diphospho)-2-C-methyl-D-erythritol kinase [Mariniblastus sp.]